MDALVLARRLGFLQLQAIALEVYGDWALGHQRVAHLAKIAQARAEWKAPQRPWPSVPWWDLSHWRQVDSVELLKAVARDVWVKGGAA